MRRPRIPGGEKSLLTQDRGLFALWSRNCRPAVEQPVVQTAAGVRLRHVLDKYSSLSRAPAEDLHPVVLDPGIYASSECILNSSNS
jgi:hypothetical protein